MIFLRTVKDIFFNAKEIILGRNTNEVTLIEKSKKNKGFLKNFLIFSVKYCIF